jgi:hypothetical protein
VNLYAIVYALVWGLCAAFPLTDSDIWWHLASAKEILAQGVLLWQDPFTFTTHGQPWFNVHWLYQLLVYGLYVLGGESTVLAGHGLAWALAAWLWLGKRPSRETLFLMIPFIIASRYLLMARPLAFTILLLGLQFRILESNRKGVHKIVLIALLQVVLANIQGLFLLGPIMLFLQLWAKKVSWRWQWGLPSLLICASAIHPAGFGILLYPLKLLQRQLPGDLFAQRIAENVSPLKAIIGDGSSAEALQSWALLGVSGLMVWGLWTNRNHARPFWILLPWFALAWLAQRNIPIALMLALPVLASALPSRAPMAWVRSAGLAVALGLLVAQLHWFAQVRSPVTPYRFPVGAANWLAANLPPDASVQIFNEARHGGYLSWRLYPKVKTYIDGRFILRDSTFFASYLQLMEVPENFEKIVQQYHIQYALIPILYPPHFKPLADYLRADPSWNLVFQDETAWLFVNSNEK